MKQGWSQTFRYERMHCNVFSNIYVHAYIHTHKQQMYTSIKKEAYRDCIKRKEDKIGITYHMVYVHVGSVLIFPESMSQPLYCHWYIRRQYRNVSLTQVVSEHYQCEHAPCVM